MKKTHGELKRFFLVFSALLFPWLALRVALIFGIGIYVLGGDRGKGAELSK
jgi:hypothetical protein